jgi:hypothetical protein
MSGRSRSTTKKLAATVAVLAGAAAFVSFGSFSAFSGSTANSSTIGTATIDLSNVPSSGTVLINLSDLIPGDVVTKCVAVTNTSTIAADVVLSAVEGGTNVTLLDGLLASVEEGTLQGGQTANAACNGFVSAGTPAFVMGSGALTLTGNYSGAKFAGNLDNQTYDDWAVNTTRYFRLKVAAPVDIAAALEGKSATLELKFDATPGRAASQSL